MPSEIGYINTDLELAARYDLNPLATVLEELGVFPFFSRQGEEGTWIARFQTSVDYLEPEATISAMLDVIEGLESDAREAWTGCTSREFDLGFRSGEIPFAFDCSVTQDTARRIAGVGAGLRITIYSGTLPEA